MSRTTKSIRERPTENAEQFDASIELLEQFGDLMVEMQAKREIAE
jgi:hypothetical protein